MQDIYTIWLREIKLFFRKKSRIISSLMFPFFWLFIFGASFGKVVNVQFEGVEYMRFMLPGVMGIVILFQSVFFGVSVIWDRRFGFLKEMLVAPITRNSIVLGKTLGGVTTVIFQVFIVWILALIYGVKMNLGFFTILTAILIMFLTSGIFVLIGIAIASRLTDPQGFQFIMNLFIVPVFFLSGVFFPINDLPSWISWASYASPLTYGIDAIRSLLIGTSQFMLVLDIAIVGGLFLIILAITDQLFKHSPI